MSPALSSSSCLYRQVQHFVCHSVESVVISFFLENIPVIKTYSFCTVNFCFIWVDT